MKLNTSAVINTAVGLALGTALYAFLVQPAINKFVNKQ